MKRNITYPLKGEPAELNNLIICFPQLPGHGVLFTQSLWRLREIFILWEDEASGEFKKIIFFI